MWYFFLLSVCLFVCSCVPLYSHNLLGLDSTLHGIPIFFEFLNVFVNRFDVVLDTCKWQKQGSFTIFLHRKKVALFSLVCIWSVCLRFWSFVHEQCAYFAQAHQTHIEVVPFPLSSSTERHAPKILRIFKGRMFFIVVCFYFCSFNYSCVFLFLFFLSLSCPLASPPSPPHTVSLPLVSSLFSLLSLLFLQCRALK